MPAIFYILFAVLAVLCSSYFLRLRRLNRRIKTSLRPVRRHAPENLNLMRG